MPLRQIDHYNVQQQSTNCSHSTTTKGRKRDQEGAWSAREVAAAGLEAALVMARLAVIPEITPISGLPVSPDCPDCHEVVACASPHPW
jgi:hypothetical protein